MTRTSTPAGSPWSRRKEPTTRSDPIDATQSQQQTLSHPIGEHEPQWTAEVALWELLAQEELANRRLWPLNVDQLECLRAPEVYAAHVDVEHTEAGRGMQPSPTYPPRPVPRVDDWHDDPVLRPLLNRWPALEALLDDEGPEGVYRWASVPADEADAYGLYTVGLTFAAIGELMRPIRNERTVRQLVGNAEDRILDALARSARLADVAAL